MSGQEELREPRSRLIGHTHGDRETHLHSHGTNGTHWHYKGGGAARTYIGAGGPATAKVDPSAGEP